MTRLCTVLVLTLSFSLPSPAQNPREKKVREDKIKVEADGFWIYNNFPKALDEARVSNKPIAVVLRCIPCEECVKLDDELVNKDPVLRPLLEKFVRVRIISTNGLDLSLFQYDYDQSLAMFFLNADGTIYGRFGTRSHRTNWVGDVSLDGLGKALQGALDLHAAYPTNKAALAGKRGPAPEFPVPEKFPTLGKYGPKLDYEGSVVPSCIHCHQVADAMKTYYRAKKEPLPEHVLFPYPHPKSQGLILDPKEMATVQKVEKGSSAELAHFKSGDVIVKLKGQPLLSIADVQWVLQQTGASGAKLSAEVVREGKSVLLVWDLPQGWRQRDDISWRSSSWALRRMATGGMLLETYDGPLPDSVAKGNMSLRVKYVGQGGPHAAAKNAGFQIGDVIVSFDGKSDLMRETDIFAHALLNRKSGDKIPVVIIRGEKKLEFVLPLQD